MERARLRHLAWGDKGHLDAMRIEYSHGFDIILGADVVYAEEFVAQLFQTARVLMKEDPKARQCSNLAL